MGQKNLTLVTELLVTVLTLPAFAGKERPDGRIATEGQNCSASKQDKVEVALQTIARKAPQEPTLQKLVADLKASPGAKKRSLMVSYFELDTAADDADIARRVDRKLGRHAERVDVDRFVDALLGVGEVNRAAGSH